MSVYSTTKFFFDISQTVVQSDYTTLASRLSFTPIGTQVEIYGYGRNLTNKRYLYTEGAGFASDNVTYATPRTYGLGVRYRF
jgi:iron complex outermembrane receptor protein